MRDINRLTNIISTTTGPYLTVVMPNPNTVSDRSKAKIKMKQVLSDATEQLMQIYPGIDMSDYLDKLGPYLSDINNWSDVTSPSCAIIIGPDNLQVVDLNHEVTASIVSVSDHPDWLTLGKNTLEQEHLILTLNQDSYKVFQGTDNHLVELSLHDDAPGTLPETLGSNELKGGQLNLRSFNGGVNFHGNNEKSQEVKNDQLNYYQKIAAYLSDHYPLTKLPVILFALPQNIAVFREAMNDDSLISHLTEPSSPSKLSLAEISQRVSSVIKKGVEHSLVDLQTDYQNLNDAQQTTEDLSQIVDCALKGQIETLIVCEGAFSSGSLTSGGLEFESEYSQHNNLYNDIANCVIENSGHLIVLQKEQMPVNSDICAMLRYPI
ncbi:hypothetical protein C5L31_000884 [Secundilactobacillus malefermentans]|uniref:Bacterial archaeo-eukaryotic release factor family 6 domain-containing protein n=1 Tax=Secundilactobacillus malefermentans TaxID=176292 RepID=A0A4R5NSC7_9LACO|nr:hypothetical protein [Secundilactobacillus malefermentans]KRM57103.1 hypothetical protein FD44_GL001426 [Secundilactobacillus malefermentans DSM 5705 = KCTC 3548]TDG79542.1 hypothetical protein C5L31_000884 [Secundilactobacillus malefermentans]